VLFQTCGATPGSPRPEGRGLRPARIWSTPGLLATAIGAVAAHSATAYWDQAYAEPRRRVTPVKQHVHSLLEVSPIMATFLITALHWDQAKALAGQDRRPPQFGLRLKRRDPCPRLRA
jgi:hypothetical protein